MMRQYIWTLLIVMLIINVVIFVFLLIKKTAMKMIRIKKEKIRQRYEAEFLNFITNQDSDFTIDPKTYLERKVLQSMILDYGSFISGATKRHLLEHIGKDLVVTKVKRYLKSRNMWKRKTGTFLAGEYELGEMTPQLLHQLKTPDNELLFVTARSLIKISNELYLKDILFEVAKRERMTKNNVLSLIDLVQGDIIETLEAVMYSGNTFLQMIALEEIGKRQYQESVKWINEMTQQPQKELRIAALKASYSLGNIGNDEYLSHIMALENDTAWEVRAFLAKFLRKVNTDKSIDILTRLMSDENWYVRHNASESLLSHDEKGQIALLRLLNAEDRFARDAANAVLQREALN